MYDSLGKEPSHLRNLLLLLIQPRNLVRRPQDPEAGDTTDKGQRAEEEGDGPLGAMWGLFAVTWRARP